MINRRFLRIKVFQALYAFYKDESAQQPIAKKNLLNSLVKSYDLFLFNLSFLAEIKYFAQLEFDLHQKKYFPSNEDQNLLKSLKNNKVINALTESNDYKEAVKKVALRWSNSIDLVRNIYNEFKSSSLFDEYKKSDEHSLKTDKDFVIGLYEMLFVESDLYNTQMDDQFINWNDDMVTILTSIQKIIHAYKPASLNVIPPFYKDEQEDIKFVSDLFDLTISHHKQLTEMIIAKTENWDEDRIAFVDNLLMNMALCEILYFPYIPVKVSINEYLELAKLYSTNQSHTFINGVLDKVQKELRKSNKITKLGRGLVE